MGPAVGNVSIKGSIRVSTFKLSFIHTYSGLGELITSLNQFCFPLGNKTAIAGSVDDITTHTIRNLIIMDKYLLRLFPPLRLLHPRIIRIIIPIPDN